MSYQALLFCPDEKTARTVTQVLGELDFSVVPCTEPFAAVKRLMGERFDAVVVDCDNEQNATLLFKSARNAPNNSSALAVAVVEGQAGVAKAFRIGANLVLTKPINVEQAKGTLRVARGLLRKNEGAKPAVSAATPAAKPSAPATARPATPANVTEMRPTPPPKMVEPVIPIQRPIPAPIQRPMSQPAAVASSASAEIEDDAPAAITMGATGPASGNFSEHTNCAPSVPARIIAASSPVLTQRQSSGAAASAPAPAREVKSAPPVEEKIVAPAPEGAREVVKAEISAPDAPTATAGQAFTFGGTVDSAKPASGGSQTKLIVVAAVVVLAAAGYATWMKFGVSKNVSTVSVQPAATQPVPAAPRPGAPAPAANTSPAAATGIPDAVVTDTPLPASPAKTLAHTSKLAPAPESPKAVADPVDSENKSSADTPATHPMVIKNDHSKPASKTIDTADAPDLSMTATSNSTTALPNLMGSSNAPTPVLQKMTVSQGVSRGLLMKQVPPSYPRNAIQMHVEGAVQLLATVSKNGDISDVKVLSGDKELGRAAVDAVKQWKYKPYLLNGEPVDIQTQITVNFKLPR
jgi:periplasmic protein TonB